MEITILLLKIFVGLIVFGQTIRYLKAVWTYKSFNLHYLYRQSSIRKWGNAIDYCKASNAVFCSSQETQKNLEELSRFRSDILFMNGDGLMGTVEVTEDDFELFIDMVNEDRYSNVRRAYDLGHRVDFKV